MSEKFVSKAVGENGEWAGCLESCAGGKWGYVWDGYR